MSTVNVSPSHAHLPIQTGDCMTAAEFRERTQHLPEGTKVELIEGIVYMAAAVKLRHGQPHLFLGAWLTQYSFATPGTEYADNVTHQLDDQNEPQPDLSLFIHPDRGGQVQISDDGNVVGGAELVAEIALSSVAVDRGPKRRVYEQHGVREYLLWRVEDNLIEWYALGDGGYRLLQSDAEGIIRSEVYPGLWMDVEATLRRDGPAAMKALQRGLDSADHLRFYKDLGGQT